MTTWTRCGVLAAVVVFLAGAGVAEAQTGPYLQLELGAAFSRPLSVNGSDNDWSTRCDRIINPMGLELGAGECSAQPPRSAWTNDFKSGRGVQTGAALGYDWGALRVEGEYTRRTTVHGDESPIQIGDAVTLGKQDQEIESALGRLDDYRAHGFFGNVYYDFGSDDAAWTPYVGAGFGVERATIDYGTHWKRNDDPAFIKTFVDPLLRAKLAGTTTVGDARLTDTVTGYQVLAGVDYRLSAAVTLGFKFRWSDFGEFMSDDTLWNELRSHQSSVGRGEDILYRITTDDARFWGLSLGLKYRF